MVHLTPRKSLACRSAHGCNLSRVAQVEHSGELRLGAASHDNLEALWRRLSRQPKSRAQRGISLALSRT
jgi:hypothetical protein